MILTVTRLILAIGSSLAALIVVKVTVMCALGLAAAWLARRDRAAVRHALLAATFAATFVLPIASIVGPAVRVAVPVAGRSPAALPLVAGNIEPVLPATAADSALVVTPTLQASTPQPPEFSMSVLLLAGWIAGTALFLLPMVSGLWQIRSLRRSGLPWPHGESIAETLAPEAGLHRRVEVLLHEALPGPIACGVLNPAIVLPVDAENWNEDDLNRAIVHELEHVRRGDSATRCLGRAVCALYWFHPLAWIAWRKLLLEAERSCDDAVLRGSEATAYADQPVELARRLPAGQSSPLLAMANRSDLSARVGALLDAGQRRGRAGTLPLILACAAALLLVVVMSPLVLVAAPQAQSQSQSQAQAQPRPGVVVAAPRANQGRPMFEVASVKRSFPEAHGATIMREFSNGRVSVEATTYSLIQAGFGVRNDQMVGGPGWIYNDYYSVNAKAERPVGASELWPMMVPLLEDRFHLKVHREKRQMPVYKLSVASGGLKFRQGACASWEEHAPPPPPAHGARFALPCGKLTAYLVEGGKEVVGGKISMSSLAEFLTRQLGHPVIDETDYKGTFDIDVKFASEFMSSPDPTGLPTASGAMREVGIKLELVKGPVEMLVIDSIDRPDQN